MCGVIGLSLENRSELLGEYASTLLKALEYRGFDSTGGAFYDEGRITLLKDVGAPSVLVKTLEMGKEKGSLFCGQVRWATFGRVDQLNSQPHVVKCKREIFGAHNGNITNCSELKQYLTLEGHTVLSDNDGEMVVHVVEHYFDIELNKLDKKKQLEKKNRSAAIKKAICLASDKIVGSFSAIITDPVSQMMYAIKSGSSLYFGVGEVDGQSFGLASSDLTAVLKFTPNLVEFSEGEFIEYSSDQYEIICYKDRTVKRYGKDPVEYAKEQIVKREPKRSKLRAEDTELLPEYKYFMDQEINSVSGSISRLVKLFRGGSESGVNIKHILEDSGLDKDYKSKSEELLKTVSFSKQKDIFERFLSSKENKKYLEILYQSELTITHEVIQDGFSRNHFYSSEKNIFIDVAGQFDRDRFFSSKALDALKEVEDVKLFRETLDIFCEIMNKAITERRNIYVIACGSSCHAAQIGTLFFNEIAGIDIRPVLPGDFRGQYSNCLRDDDIIIGVSQSGETKDLIDIIDDIETKNINVKKIMIVNNMNSTLGTQKSDVSIPINSGPEIAIPATKSFINQLTVFYFLAIKTLEERIKLTKAGASELKGDLVDLERELRRREKSLETLPLLIQETINTTDESVERVASKLYLAPSMQILGTRLSGVAKEAALKVRETVLNHTEGAEASEFKHGPNTILGKNTTFGLESISYMTKYFYKIAGVIQKRGKERGISGQDINDIIHELSTYFFERTMPFNLTKKGIDLFKEIVREYNFFDEMIVNYPIIYITGPGERDINLTISQMNTHKIRGANTIIVAEEDDRLLENSKYDDETGKYYADYIKLPKSGDHLLTSFSATVAMQLLSMKMSVKKMNYLNKLGMEGHGVHPDVPKNVSKSITVD